MNNWQENLTWEQIIEMEEQGCDVSEIKENFMKEEARIMKEEAQNEETLNILRFTMDHIDEKYVPNKTNVTKIESMINDCRNPQSEIIKDTVGKPLLWGLLGKDKWEEGIKDSDVLFTSVVQCHPQLWEEVTEDIAPAVCLLVYSLNSKYMRNIEVLKKVSKLLGDFRDLEYSDVEGNYSGEMVQLHRDLDNPGSMPHKVLDKTLLQEIGITEQNADIRITNEIILESTPLKNKRLPSDGILPFIRFKEKNFGVDVSFSYATRIIPSKYYE